MEKIEPLLQSCLTVLEQPAQFTLTEKLPDTI
jgi:hypothetical protein